MEGIEILSSTSIYNTMFSEWVITISIMLTFVSLILAVICASFEEYGWLALCVVLMMVMFTVAIYGCADNKDSVHHMEHKVIINDSVKMNDFLEKYEIIDQEGKIYTVRERE